MQVKEEAGIVTLATAGFPIGPEYLPGSQGISMAILSAAGAV